MNIEKEKSLQLKDPEYYRKVKEIASIHYELNPDRIKPAELIKYNNIRNTSRVLRRLIDKELERLNKYQAEVANKAL